MIISISRDTSAWNSNFSALLRSDLFEIDSASLQSHQHIKSLSACSQTWFYRSETGIPLGHIWIGWKSMRNSADLVLHLRWIYELVGIAFCIRLKLATCGTMRSMMRKRIGSGEWKIEKEMRAYLDLHRGGRGERGEEARKGASTSSF